MSIYPDFIKMTELGKYKWICRYQYLTLGMYATERNYEKRSEVTYPDGSKMIHIMRDKGEDAREAMKIHEKTGIKKEDFCKHNKD